MRVGENDRVGAVRWPLCDNDHTEEKDTEQDRKADKEARWGGLWPRGEEDQDGRSFG